MNLWDFGLGALFSSFGSRWLGRGLWLRFRLGWRCVGLRFGFWCWLLFGFFGCLSAFCFVFFVFFGRVEESASDFFEGTLANVFVARDSFKLFDFRDC